MLMPDPFKNALGSKMLSRRTGLFFVRAVSAARWAVLAIVLGAGFPGAGYPAVLQKAFGIRLEQMAHPDARDPGKDDSDRVETGVRPLLGALDWGNRRFLHYGHRTYWTADGGRSWRSQGWMETGAKTRPLLPQARFRSAGAQLYLVSGEGAPAAASFDPVKDEWIRVDFGRTGKPAATAVGCDAGAVYLYDVARELSRSRDGGASWQRIAEVPPPEGASFYEDIEAEGSRLLLRFNRPYGISTDAASTDGGATWRRLPAGADAHLFEGCFHFVAVESMRALSSLHSECGPDVPDRIAPAPFTRLDRLFRQEGGELFALADSGLYHFRPAGSGTDAAGIPGSSGSWEPVIGMGPAEGWTVSNGMVSRQTGTTVAWMPVPAQGAVSIRPGKGRRTRPGVTRELPAWIEAGRRPDGRAF